MQEQQFLIKNFELFPAKNQSALFYTPELSAHVTHSKIVDLLRQLKLQASQEINEAKLDYMISSYGLECRTVKKYLVRSIKILTPLEGLEFKKLFLVIEDEFIKSMLEKYFSRGNGVSVYSSNDFSALDQDSLVLFFQKNYLPQDFEEMTALVSERNAWLISSYLANEYLLIDNIYNLQKGVPCHFCNYYRHQNIVMSTNNVKKSSWINFCRKAISEEISFFPSITTTEIEKCSIVYWLGKVIKKFLGNDATRFFMNETTLYSWINLLNGEMNQDHAVHWNFCECLQRKCA